MTCPDCPDRGARYNLRCLDCCTRLVMSAYPSKPRAAAMLAAIERMRDNPGRDAVLAAVAAAVEARR